MLTLISGLCCRFFHCTCFMRCDFCIFADLVMSAEHGVWLPSCFPVHFSVLIVVRGCILHIQKNETFLSLFCRRTIQIILFITENMQIVQVNCFFSKIWQLPIAFWHQRRKYRKYPIFLTENIGYILPIYIVPTLVGYWLCYRWRHEWWWKKSHTWYVLCINWQSKFLLYI